MPSSFTSRRWLNFWILWAVYAFIYTCRQNLSVAQPLMEAEFEWTKTKIGLIATAFSVAYALGQFINGQLADRFGGKKILLLGAVVSLGANVAFGLSSSFVVLCSVWAINGYFLAMAVPATARINSYWYSVRERGVYMGLFGTCGQAGTVLGLLMAGLVVAYLPWRYAFYIPPLFLGAFVIAAYFLLSERPEDLGLPEVQEGSVSGKPVVEDNAPASVGYTIRFILSSKPILVMSLNHLLLGIIRNGFLIWAPTYIVQDQAAPIDKAAFKLIAMPLVGCLGAIFAGWASQRFFGHRRAPICVLMLLGLAVAILLFRLVPAENWVLSTTILGLSGFFMLGPYTLNPTCSALDFGSRKAAASAAGLINGSAYVGAALSGVGLGWVVERFGWNGCFAVWVLSALLGAALMATIWNALPKETAAPADARQAGAS